MDNKEKTLIIMRACSGAGKSTYIKNNFPGAFVCSADHFLFDPKGMYIWEAEKLSMAHELCKKSCELAMSIWNQSTIVIDNTNTKLSEIKPYVEMAKKYGYHIRIIRLVIEPKTAAHRNVHNVPEEVIKKQFDRINSGLNTVSEYLEKLNIKEEVVENY